MFTMNPSVPYQTLSWEELFASYPEFTKDHHQRNPVQHTIPLSQTSSILFSVFFPSQKQETVIPVNYHARREHSPGKARDSSSGCIYARDELNIEGEGREIRCKAGGLEHLFLHDGARDNIIHACS